jgi:hypothetical protein
MKKVTITLAIMVSSIALFTGNAFSWGCGPGIKCPTTTTTTTTVPETTTTTIPETTTTTTTVPELAPPVSIVREPKQPKLTG